MLSIILLIFISLLVFVSTAVSNESKLFNKKEKNLKKITPTGWIVFGINLIIISLSVGQYKLGENEIDQRDSLQRISYTQSVEQITKNANKNSLDLKYSYDTTSIGLKNRYDTSTTNIVKALAKYGLKYDTEKNTIEKLVKNSNNANPVFMLAPTSEIKLTDSVLGKYTITYISMDAGSTNFDIKSYYVVEFKNNNLKYCGRGNLLGKNIQMPTNTPLEDIFTYKFIFEDLYILLKGTCTNLDKSKTFQIDIIYSYNYASKITSVISDEFATKIKNFISSSDTTRKVERESKF